jgi:hypothetical protein
MAGRKNYYDTQIKPNLENIEHWIREGYSHDQIMDLIGVKSTTWYKYAASESAFKEALKVGTAKLGVNLEKALYKEAEGFEYVETHVEIDESPLGKKTKKKKVTKYARSNAQLLIFALCNKFPKKWRRVDKEIIDAIEEGKVKLDVTDKHIKDAFKALYPAMDEKGVEKVLKETEKFREDTDKNGNKSKKEKGKK